ncbi:LysR family transcriptional regulator [Bdellovibrio sp. BCCA]|uniref:LysR family transcriptional regulator n=1 Tax=Bdellovibrio sp. BCCA TaxID=3136281 RepID=UPI0030F36712
MDRFNSMQIFVRVAELESFTKAAESLSVPKATVSTNIQQLESSLGVRLLHRTTRKVQMTQDGLSFYERCKDLLADVEETESMFRKNSGSVTGRIRVDMGVGIARSLVLPRMPEFMDKYPNVEIEFSCSDRRVDLIREGFDCVIRVGHLNDSGLIARPLGKLTLINCASPTYLEKNGRPKKLEDLTNHKLIHYVPILGSKPDGFEYFDGEKYRTIKMKGSVAVNNTDAYTSACLAGMGIIQVPVVGVKSLLKEEKLIEVLPKLRAEPMPVSLVYPHRRNLAKRVQLFMDWVQGLMNDYVD